MKHNFQQSTIWLIALEGGETHHTEGDPGGRTSGAGVTQTLYNTYRKRKGLPKQPVDYITAEETDEIMRVFFWDLGYCSVGGQGCDDLEDGVDFAVFQHAVNTGPRDAVKSLQKALKVEYKDVKVDGKLGKETVHVHLCSDTYDTLERFFDCQVDFYKRLVKRKPGMRPFYKGLVNRVLRTAEFINFNYIPKDGDEA